MSIKKITVLGSTGSIGTQTLEVIKNNPERFSVEALLGGSNLELLANQAKEFNPKLIAISNEKAYTRNKHLFVGLKSKIVVGDTALQIAAKTGDTIVAAVSGMAGFMGVYEAAKLSKTIAIANKETLVAGGKFIMNLAKKQKAKIIPVDSEHSAVWQCLQGSNKKNLKRIILTASGGPFFSKTKEEIYDASIEQATFNPNWNMGKKISVDSSTMMNKGLEIIEARWLFDTQNIDYVIHRQSIIHSLVEFIDGTMLAQMSNPSMLYPIQLALTYPKRLPINSKTVSSFSFDKSLTFDMPDEKTFIMPKLAKQALVTHEGAPLVLNAANEAAVYLFLNKSIQFGHIFSLVQNVLDSADFCKLDSADMICNTHNLWYNKILQDYKLYL